MGIVPFLMVLVALALGFYGLDRAIKAQRESESVRRWDVGADG